MNGAMDALRLESRRLADAGSWAQVTALLADSESAVRDHPECATLFGEALLKVGRAREASFWFAALLRRLESSPDRATLRRAALLAGHAHLEVGEMQAARRAFERGFDIARLDGDDIVAARAMNNLGIVANIEGRHEDALALYHLTLSVWQRLGSSRGMAECYHNMAITYRDLGRLDDADEFERKSVEFAHDAANERLAALARLGRAELALRRGDAALAEVSARRVAVGFARLGDPVREADALRLAGVACTAQGKYAAADELIERALTAMHAHGAVLNEAEAWRARAELRAATGDIHAAVWDARRAMDLFASLKALRETRDLAQWIATLRAPEAT